MLVKLQCLSKAKQMKLPHVNIEGEQSKQTWKPTWLKETALKTRGRQLHSQKLYVNHLITRLRDFVY